MTNLYTPPYRDTTPFHCPHCNVLAQQVWRELFWKELANNVPSHQFAGVEPTSQDQVVREPKISLDLGNTDMLAIAECQNCKKVSIWVYDEMLYPGGQAPPPNSDLTQEIIDDYNEAAFIVNKSPRGACALLRLCLQKLCIQLDAEGSRINDQIAFLVSEKNLNPMIQQSLDTVRVIGNEAVHPGQLDLHDDKDTALSLFNLINLIADTMITQPAQIQEMYDKLPESKLKGIEARDSRSR